MSGIGARTVTLELLRHGPAHNQLLSPETAYLALSGNHDAETFHVKIEHVRLVQQLQDLRYGPGQEAEREARLREASIEVSRIFSSIRSLGADLAAASGERRLVHLRLVLSATELSMLPFELAVAPPGLPGAGRPLSLQTETPIVLTREVRRVAPGAIQWPDRPRVLVAAASPVGLPEVPLTQLVLSLRQAFGPWLTEGSARALAQHVTVLPRASLGAIQAECARQRYSHVHLLAHGLRMPMEGGFDARYGLALHVDHDPTGRDLVSGERLAAVLRPGGDDRSPVVVTLASCDSGNVGSVITPGASIAHKLHEAGVPLVVASQLPLSFRGAAVLAKVLYAGLLWGEDPRAIVRELRLQLSVHCPDTHDWASLVVYAALPTDIDQQVGRLTLQRRRRAVDAAMARLDGSPAGDELADRALKEAMIRLEEAVPPATATEDRMRRADASGRLAGAEKRFAHILYDRARRLEEAGAEGASPAIAEARRSLSSARAHYLEAFRLDASATWALVQSLSLDVALGNPFDETAWSAARGLSRFALLPGTGRQQVIWARGALNELAVLAQLLPEGHGARARAGDEAHEHLGALLGLVEPGSVDAYLVKRQLTRYAEWWWKGDPALRALPAAMVTLLDARGVPSRWDWT